MTVTTITENTTFRRMCCSECRIVYWFPEDWCNLAEKDETRWTCPNGHGQWFGESEETKLRRERDRLKQQAAQKDDEIARQMRLRDMEKRTAAAYKGQATKLRKRATSDKRDEP